ncbi:galactose-1-epimerase [Leminorella grimontii]|uniref:galactose-1-epimerase n=1 Tax=Leminorella grimontii TaxID=82981 RepID=UPI002082391F|nr:galactose-1-epimerase [Leminorella grimontii]GKX57722.1 aldose 1-epimerase [Leminorella grimontii]
MLTASPSLAPDGAPFTIIHLTNRQGMRVALMDWGATWLSCELPMGAEEMREVLLGCSSPEGYLRQTAYLGATVGRYANRIAFSRITRGELSFTLVPNQGEHQLHGGANGPDRRRWSVVRHDENSATFSLDSPDGDNGFPGNLHVEVTYTLTDDGRVEISYFATVDSLCPVNFTNHAYFNLDGKSADCRTHRLQIDADYFLPVDKEGIPGAGLTPVTVGGMDFRQPKRIAQDFLADDCQRKVSGYDHAYLLSERCREGKIPAARLWSSDERVVMSVYTTKPALQFYSGNFLAGTPSRDGGEYGSFAGLALESEFLPDSPNHPEWPQPDCWLKPGEDYRSTTVYQFSLIN